MLNLTAHSASKTLLALSLTLAACSGDSSSGATPAVKSLLPAYEKVDKGMSYEQVTAIVGFASNAGKSEYTGGRIDYKWETGKNTAAYELMDVQFETTGVKGKILAGASGTFSKSY
jgi:hypothetical protein